MMLMAFWMISTLRSYSGMLTANVPTFCVMFLITAPETCVFKSLDRYTCAVVCTDSFLGSTRTRFSLPARTSEFRAV